MARKNQTKPALTPTVAERLLTPAEKAKQLGVSADTLRRWENEGRIQSARTAGGQRRYREGDRPRSGVEAEADAYADGGDDGDEQEFDPKNIEPAGATPPAPTVPSWQERIEERRADVEIARLDREHRAILRAEAQEREERRRQRDDAARRASADRERQAAALRETQRLDGIVQQGMMLAMAAPLEFQAAARRELIAFVTTERFPMRLSQFETGALLVGRVEEVLKPWRERQRIEELIREARTHASLRTLGSDWDYQPAQEARRAVEARLSREVDATWTKDDIHTRVDEILDEWD